MKTATVTITRHFEGSSKVTLVKGKKYSAEEVAAMPTWYQEYLV